jgi:hypothetical protein
MPINMCFSLRIGDEFVPEDRLFPTALSLAEKVEMDYVQGIIYIRYNDHELIGKNEEDYLSQLLSYILNSLDMTIEGHFFSTYYPDQPLKLEIKRNEKTLYIRIGEKQSIFNAEEFFQEIYDLCRRYFDALARIYPSARKDYSSCYNALEKLPICYPWISPGSIPS